MSASVLSPEQVVTIEVKTTLREARLSDIVGYFILAFLGTWITFLPLIFDPTLSRELFAFLFVLSTFSGPTLAAVVMTARMNGTDGVRALLGRALQWRVNIVWYLAAVFGFMVVLVAGYSIAFNPAPVQGLAAQPQAMVMVFLSFIVTMSLIPAVGEEIGWRGFALTHLQKRFNPITATLILGLLHTLWHLPAFFTPVLGPFVPLGFLTFVITGTAATFIYTWIFNNARQSILIAVLIHAASNGTNAVLGVLLADAAPTNDFMMNLLSSGWLNPIIFVSVAVVLVAATRGRLGYKADEV